MKKLFTLKFLLVALSLCILTACSDDEKVATKGQFTLQDEATKIASGFFVYDTSPNTDGEENVYHRNQIIFYGKGLKVLQTGPEPEPVGEGNLLELYINNEGQTLETGTYTWQAEENEQPFDLWYGLLTLGVNSGDETDYRLQSGEMVVSKSGSAYKITFTGTAYLEFEGEFKQNAGLPALTVTATFEGKLKRVGFDF